MKKLLCLLLCCFLLVGCGKTKETTNATKNETKNETKEETKKSQILSCSKDIENDINFNTEMTYYFESDKLVNLGIKYVYDLSSYTDEQRQVFAGSKMCENESITERLGMRDCKEELSGSNYIVTGYADKLLQQTSGTLKALQAYHVGDGWTCTTK